MASTCKSHTCVCAPIPGTHSLKNKTERLRTNILFWSCGGFVTTVEFYNHLLTSTFLGFYLCFIGLNHPYWSPMPPSSAVWRVNSEKVHWLLPGVDQTLRTWFCLLFHLTDWAMALVLSIKSKLECFDWLFLIGLFRKARDTLKSVCPILHIFSEIVSRHCCFYGVFGFNSP